MTSIGEISPAMAQSLRRPKRGTRGRKGRQLGTPPGAGIVGVPRRGDAPPWCPCGAPSPLPSRRASPVYAWKLSRVGRAGSVTRRGREGLGGSIVAGACANGVCGIGGFPRAGRARTFLDHLEDLLVKADVRQGLGDGAHGAKLPVAAVAVLLDLGRGLVLLLFLVLPLWLLRFRRTAAFLPRVGPGWARRRGARESRLALRRAETRDEANNRRDDGNPRDVDCRARATGRDLPPPPTIRK